MEKAVLLKKTIYTLSKLPKGKIKEVSNFVQYLSEKYEEDILQKGTERLICESKAFDFLQEEEDLYSLEDLKVRF